MLPPQPRARKRPLRLCDPQHIRRLSHPVVAHTTAARGSISPSPMPYLLPRAGDCRAYRIKVCAGLPGGDQPAVRSPSIHAQQSFRLCGSAGWCPLRRAGLAVPAGAGVKGSGAGGLEPAGELADPPAPRPRPPAGYWQWAMGRLFLSERAKRRGCGRGGRGRPPGSYGTGCASGAAGTD